MDRNLLEAFLKESWGGLGQLETALADLRSSSSDVARLDRIGPALRSIKANAAFLELQNLAALADTLQRLLDRLSSGKLDPSEAALSVLAGAAQAMRDLLECIEATGRERQPADPDLLDSLTALLETRPTPESEQTPAEAETARRSDEAVDEDEPKDPAPERPAEGRPQQPVEQPVENPLPTGPCRVLLVDDSPFYRQLVRASLESDGHEVVLAENGIRALELIENGEQFDAVVSDIAMPGMDGFTLAQQLRERWQINVPMIAISQLSPELAEQRALESGFDRFLTKFHSKRFLATLAELRRQPSAASRASA